MDVSSPWKKERKKPGSLPEDQGSSEKADVKNKVLKEVLNCKRKLPCRMGGGR